MWSLSRAGADPWRRWADVAPNFHPAQGLFARRVSWTAVLTIMIALATLLMAPMGN
jgi:hypothetical protein